MDLESEGWSVQYSMKKAENGIVDSTHGNLTNQVYESIVDHLFPIICSFFMGSWSDTFGRKLLLYIYFIFR